VLPPILAQVDAKVQRALVRAVKTARMMAILPYTERLPAFTKGRKNPYV
jgi:ribosomal protein S18